MQEEGIPSISFAFLVATAYQCPLIILPFLNLSSKWHLYRQTVCSVCLPTRTGKQKQFSATSVLYKLVLVDQDTFLSADFRRHIFICFFVWKQKWTKAWHYFIQILGLPFLIMTQTLGKPAEGMLKLSKLHEQLDCSPQSDGFCFLPQAYVSNPRKTLKY